MEEDEETELNEEFTNLPQFDNTDAGRKRSRRRSFRFDEQVVVKHGGMTNEPKPVSRSSAIAQRKKCPSQQACQGHFGSSASKKESNEWLLAFAPERKKKTCLEP